MPDDDKPTLKYCQTCGNYYTDPHNCEGPKPDGGINN